MDNNQFKKEMADLVLNGLILVACIIILLLLKTL